MILLSGHSLTPARKVPLEGHSLNLTERQSTAEIVPADASDIGIGSWLQDDTDPGKGIVWRVKTITKNPVTDTTSVSLEHIINTLRDVIIPNEVTTATLAGNTKATACTAKAAINYALGLQSDWVLGSFDYESVTGPYKLDGQTLFDALEYVTGTLSDAWWTYDTTVYPFKINIVMESTATGSILRAGRNVTAYRMTIDTSGMYTRFYPVGKDDIRLSGTGYMELNTDLYGVISHTETDTGLETEAELRQWATERLAKHAKPVFEYQIDALDLSESTGESLDSFAVGRVVVMTYKGESVRELITKIQYPDKLFAPEVAKMTLSNSREDVAHIIADAIKKSRGGGRSSAKQQKEDHAWFEDTTEHVAMVAKGIVGVDSTGEPNWERISEIYVDGTGIYQSVQSVQGDLTVAETRITETENAITLEAERATAAEGALSSRLTVTADAISAEVTRATKAEGTLSSRITVNANAITAEVTRATAAEGSLSSRITVNANSISAEVTRASTAEGNLSSRITANAESITAEVTRATGVESSLSSRITVNADSIETKVSADGVISAINQTAESVTINASKINLSGYVTASELSTTNAKISNLTSGVTTASSLKATAMNAVTGFTYQNHAVSFKSVTIDGTSYHLMGY